MRLETPDRDETLLRATEVLFASQDGDAVLRACELLAGDVVKTLRQWAEPAVRGNRQAVRRYLRAYRRLLDALLTAAHDWNPDLVLETERGFTIATATGEPSRVACIQLMMSAVEAPFSVWVSAYGPGAGVSLEAVSRVRSSLRVLDPVTLPARKLEPPPWEDIDEEAWLRFLHLVEAEVVRIQSSRAMLSRLMPLFGVNLTELGSLFGVSRQAISEWLDKGVPTERLAKLQAVLNVGDLLERKLRAGRLPAVCRRPAEAYGKVSMLEMIAADRHQELLEEVRRSFDWAATA